MSATLDGAFPAMQDVVSTVETKADPEPSAIAPFSFPHMNGETAKADPNLNFLNVSHESAPGPSSLRASSAALSDAPSSPLSELPPPAAQRTSTRVVESSQSAGLHMSEIVASDGAFEAVHRVDVTEMTRESMSALIEEYMVTKGEPLVIGGFQKFPKWTPDLLTPERLVQELSADGPVPVRNVLTLEDRALPLQELLDHMSTKGPHITEGESERLYGKDLKCPQAWEEFLRDNMLPPEVIHLGNHDFMANVPAVERTDTLMCYLGFGDTFTPGHKDLCSSLGQNIMTYADPDTSAMWFLTRTQDADAASAFWRGLGQELDLETYVATPNELSAAPFPVFVCEQVVGDLILIPSRACHQVINKGGKSIKVAWSRLTASTLESSLHDELPLYQRICRKEAYKTKGIIEASVKALTERCASDPRSIDRSVLRRLLVLLDEVLADEYHPDWQSHRLINWDDGWVTCDFCGADVWQSYFECQSCEPSFTLCSMCYAQGRTCICDSAALLEPCQMLPFSTRLEVRNKAAEILGASGDATIAPVGPLTYKALDDSPSPRSYQAACTLYWIRQQGNEENTAMCRFCKAVHTAPNRYKCKPCHNGFCWPCILRRFYIHPIIALADDDADKFHAMHRGDNRRDYEQWSSSPSRETSRHGHYTLVRAAISNPLCRPLDARCRLGFIDDLWAPGNVARVSTTVTTPTLTPTPKREIPHRSSKRAVEANGISIPDSAVRVDGSVKRPRRSSPKRKLGFVSNRTASPDLSLTRVATSTQDADGIPDGAQVFSSSPSIHLAPDAQQQQQHHHRALLHSSPDPREQAAIDRHNQLINLITASNESLDRQMKQVLLRVGALEDRMDQLFSDISNGIGTSFERTQI